VIVEIPFEDLLLSVGLISLAILAALFAVIDE
jgi:hypothetical protein